MNQLNRNNVLTEKEKAFICIIFGIASIALGVWERVYFEGPHFGGVYAIIGGAFFVFKAWDYLRKNKKTKFTKKT